MTTSLIKPSRRGFVTSLGALFIAAPAIVRAASLMPVKRIPPKIIDITDPFLPYPTDPNVWFLKGPIPPLVSRNMDWVFD